MNPQNPESRFWEIDAKLGKLLNNIGAQLSQPTEPKVCESCDGSGWLRRLCGACNGSGEGMRDGSRCIHCHGSGEVQTHCECKIDDGDLTTIIID